MKDELALFEGPRLNLAACREDVERIGRAIDVFGDNCKFEFKKRYDPWTREGIASLRFKDRLPDGIRPMVGRCVNEIRHSIDQALCDAALLLGVPEKKLRPVQFPTGGDASNLAGAAKKLEGLLPSELCAFLVAQRSFPGGNDILWALGNVARHKHQRIVHIGLSDASIRWAVHEAKGPLTLLINTTWQSVERELDIARVAPFGELDLSIGVKPNVIFAPDFKVVGNRPVLEVLMEFLVMAEQTIGAIEVEASRLAGR